MNLRALLATIVGAGALLGTAKGTLAEGVPGDALRVAFLYNFAKFTEWPEEAWGDGAAPFVLVVHGDAEFERVVEQAMRARTIHGRRVEVRRSDEGASALTCHLLYVAAASTSAVERTLQDHRHGSVLTVGEGLAFVEGGGVVGLFEAQGRIQFEINLERARASGLHLSSKLLALAKHVHGQGRRDDR